MSKKSLFIVSILAIATTACTATTKTDGTLGYPADYRDRHKIGLYNKTKSLNIYPLQSPDKNIDQRQKTAIFNFIKAYKATGKSSVIISMPEDHSANNISTVKRSANNIKKYLNSIGISNSNIVSNLYAADPNSGINPIKIEFIAVEASVPQKCGQWPDDLGVANFYHYENEQFWNFGCAYQSNIASQVANPLDLMVPENQIPSETHRRINQLDKFRTNTDTPINNNKSSESN